MSPRIRLSGARLALCLGLTAVMAAYSADAPTRPVDRQRQASFSVASAGKVALGPRTGSGAGLREGASPGRAGDVGHGDYVTTVLVSHDAGPTGDGVHFARLPGLVPPPVEKAGAPRDGAGLHRVTRS